MPVNYARKLTGRDRTKRADRQLGITLAFIAGAINAGGFLAVNQYTSHVSGILSSMADNLTMGSLGVAAGGLGALLAFAMGAMVCALLVNYARQRQLRSRYALPLLLEALLLLLFGLLGGRLTALELAALPAAVMLLTFLMGLQDALITKISQAEIRTTHMTGIVTDLGIELGRLFHVNAPDAKRPVRANRDKLRLLLALACAFFAGGLVGALSFQRIGYVATVPLALLLIALAGVPALDDLAIFLARLRRPRAQADTSKRRGLGGM
jgi:uncharacterized membrane protein YoaK (UPF0700 family)